MKAARRRAGVRAGELFGTAGAACSTCGAYRYRLWRTWDEAAGLVCWVMLNPSTADAEQDDPTIRRCLGFAEAWGYGGIEVVNLFGLRATDPRVLYQHPDPVGPNNDGYVMEAAARASRLVAAWGHCGRYRERSARVTALLVGLGPPLECLGLTRDGSPRHPLYVRGDAQPQCYVPADLGV